MRPPRAVDTPAADGRAQAAAPRRTPATRSRRVLALIAALALVWMTWAFMTQYARTYALGRQAARLDQQRRDLIAANQALRDEIQRLKTDDGYLEWLARKELGMVRPGEVEFLIVSPHPAGTANERQTAGGASGGRPGSETGAFVRDRGGPDTGAATGPPPNRRPSHTAPAGWLERLLARLSSLIEQLRFGR